MKPPIDVTSQQAVTQWIFQLAKLTKSACKVDPRGAFTTSFWVRIEKIRTNRSGGDDGRKVVHGPTDGKDPPGPGLRIMQGGTDEVITDDLEWQDQPQDDQPVLWLKATAVVSGVQLANKVKEE